MPRPEIKKPDKNKHECCRMCYYKFWLGLAGHCYHPDIDKPIKNSLAKCEFYVDEFKKNKPGKPIEYKKRLKFKTGAVSASDRSP